MTVKIIVQTLLLIIRIYLILFNSLTFRLEANNWKDVKSFKY